MSFSEVYCSQCGNEFQGNFLCGFSSCADHSIKIGDWTQNGKLIEIEDKLYGENSYLVIKGIKRAADTFKIYITEGPSGIVRSPYYPRQSTEAEVYDQKEQESKSMASFYQEGGFAA